jgi:transcriptional repressor NrdR
MQCPYCRCEEQKVIESRPAREGAAIRRRRECLGCLRRFTTFEEPEALRLFVVKRDGSREPFDESKVLNSMAIACRKRQVPTADLQGAVDRIVLDLMANLSDEVSSSEIGERVLRELRNLDIVAYVRFASVYREFETLDDFEAIVAGFKSGPEILRSALMATQMADAEPGEKTAKARPRK